MQSFGWKRKRIPLLPLLWFAAVFETVLVGVVVVVPRPWVVRRPSFLFVSLPTVVFFYRPVFLVRGEQFFLSYPVTNRRPLA